MEKDGSEYRREKLAKLWDQIHGAVTEGGFVDGEERPMINALIRLSGELSRLEAEIDKKGNPHGKPGRKTAPPQQGGFAFSDNAGDAGGR